MTTTNIWNNFGILYAVNSQLQTFFIMSSKFSIIVALIFFTIIGAFAQGKIEFEKNTHDFGVVEEGATPTYLFYFKNIGDDTVRLSSVKPSCGCTSPFWSKDPIAPGDTGSIKVVYNSKGRPGPFNKAVNVVSNAENEHIVVHIRGIVNKAEEKPVYTAEQLANSPKININKTNHNFGKIEKNKNKSYSFVVSNTGKDPLKINNVQAGCKCVTFKISKEEIPTGESATLELTYFPRSLGDVKEIVTIFSNDRNTPHSDIILDANVVESLTERTLMQEGGGFGF